MLPSRAPDYPARMATSTPRPASARPARSSRSTSSPAASAGPAPTRVSTRKHVAPSKRVVTGSSGVKVSRAVTIRKPARDLYAFWRHVENIPLIVKHPVRISAISELQSHWSVSAPPGDRRVEWTALIINDEPDRLIAWRSRDDAEIANAGTVRFSPAPGDEGTELVVTLEYKPPGGKLGAWLAKFTGEEAGQQVAEALRRLKALMEAGEIPTIKGQPAGYPQRKDSERLKDPRPLAATARASRVRPADRSNRSDDDDPSDDVGPLPPPTASAPVTPLTTAPAVAGGPTPAFVVTPASAAGSGQTEGSR